MGHASRANRAPGAAQEAITVSRSLFPNDTASPAYLTSEHLGQVTDDHVRAVRAERIGVADAGRRR